jgi:hypothetical protein
MMRRLTESFYKQYIINGNWQTDPDDKIETGEAAIAHRGVELSQQRSSSQPKHTTY